MPPAVLVDSTNRASSSMQQAGQSTSNTTSSSSGAGPSLRRRHSSGGSGAGAARKRDPAAAGSSSRRTLSVAGLPAQMIHHQHQRPAVVLEEVPLEEELAAQQQQQHAQYGAPDTFVDAPDGRMPSPGLHRRFSGEQHQQYAEGNGFGPDELAQGEGDGECLEDEDGMGDYEELAGSHGMRRRPSSNGGRAGAGIQESRGGKRDRRSFAPPTNPEHFETEADWRAHHEQESKVSSWHNLPLFVVILPPLGAVLHGRAEDWTDAMILVLICFYLHYIVKTPWEIYYASRTRRIVHASVVHAEDDEAAREEPWAIQARLEAQHKLERAEMLSLFATLAGPVAGAYLLYYARHILYDPDRYINPFTVSLFALSTGVRPLRHLASLLKNRSLYYQEAVHYPSTDVYLLRKKVERLEDNLAQLTKAFATKSDVRTLRDGIDTPLTQLSKAVRRYERKEEYLRLSSEGRFALLNSRIDEAEREMNLNADMIDQIRREQQAYHPVAAMLRLVSHVLAPSTLTSSRASVAGPSTPAKLKWFERGPLYYIFFPLSVSTRAIEYATSSSVDDVAPAPPRKPLNGNSSGLATPRRRQLIGSSDVSPVGSPPPPAPLR